MSSRNFTTDSPIHQGSQSVEAPLPLPDATPETLKPLPVKLAKLNAPRESFINGVPWFPRPKRTAKAPNKNKKRKTVSKSIPKKPKASRKGGNARLSSPPLQPPNTPFEPTSPVRELVWQTSNPFERRAEYHASPFERSLSTSSWATDNDESFERLNASSPLSSAYWLRGLDRYMPPQATVSALPEICHSNHNLHSGHSQSPLNVPQVSHRSRQCMISSQVSPAALGTIVHPELGPQHQMIHSSSYIDISSQMAPAELNTLTIASDPTPQFQTQPSSWFSAPLELAQGSSADPLDDMWHRDLGAMNPFHDQGLSGHHDLDPRFRGNPGYYTQEANLGNQHHFG